MIKDAIANGPERQRLAASGFGLNQPLSADSSASHHAARREPSEMEASGNLRLGGPSREPGGRFGHAVVHDIQGGSPEFGGDNPGPPTSRPRRNEKNNLSLTFGIHHHDRRDHARFARQRSPQGSRYSPGTRSCIGRRVLRDGAVAWYRRWRMQAAGWHMQAALRSTTNFQYWRQNKPIRLMTDPPPCTAVDWDNRTSGPNHSG
jgi:hypothetical protein